MGFGRVLAGILSGGISEIPGVRQGFDQLMGQGNYDPTKKAMPYLEQIPGQLHQGYDPYVQQGQQAGNQLYPDYSNMMKDPGAYLESLMQGYAPSTAYKQKFGQMSQAAANTAAAGGMRGSLGDIQSQAGIADTLMGEDMQQWLQNVMGIKGAGMQGLGNFYNKGYEANESLTSGLSNLLGSQAGLSFQGQSQQNKNLQDLIMSLISGGSKVAGAMGGGGAGAAGAGGGFM